jgi:hypothetical protein
MSQKCEKMYVRTTSVKMHRKNLSLPVKLNVVRYINAGQHQLNVCKEAHLVGSTQQPILKNTNKIKICGKTATPLRDSELNSTLCTSSC